MTAALQRLSAHPPRHPLGERHCQRRVGFPNLREDRRPGHTGGSCQQTNRCIESIHKENTRSHEQRLPTNSRAASANQILELAAAILESRIAGEPMTSPADTRRYLQYRLAHYEHEVFGCLYLDNRHRVIQFEEMFRGTIDGASVYPREIVKTALSYNAAALILTHNHPSGVVEPSRSDRALTARVRDALELVDVRVLDHIVVGSEGSVSFAERGWL